MNSTDLSKHSISLSCTKCQTKNQVKIKQMLTEEVIQCVGCGEKIKLKDKDGSLKQSFTDVQSSIDSIKMELEKLGLNLTVTRSSK